jgi:hypothetical protein
MLAFAVHESVGLDLVDRPAAGVDLGDPRRAVPERLRTIIRQPFLVT